MDIGYCPCCRGVILNDFPKVHNVSHSMKCPFFQWDFGPLMMQEPFTPEKEHKQDIPVTVAQADQIHQCLRETVSPEGCRGVDRG
jgi:hypothetical protein